MLCYNGVVHIQWFNFIFALLSHSCYILPWIHWTNKLMIIKKKKEKQFRKSSLFACWWCNAKLSNFWCGRVGGYEIPSNLMLCYLTCFCTMYVYQLYMWSDISVWNISTKSKYWGTYNIAYSHFLPSALYFSPEKIKLRLDCYSFMIHVLFLWVQTLILEWKSSLSFFLVHIQCRFCLLCTHL